MSIQLKEADKLEKAWKGGKCSHAWEKEYYLGTNTGDYRCSICGATCSSVEMDEIKKSRFNSNKNK